jgi:hypothetical protein
MELSEIRGLRVKCDKCKSEEEFLFPLQEPITVHMCQDRSEFASVFMDDIATTAKIIQAGGSGPLKVSFLLSDTR